MAHFPYRIFTEWSDADTAYVARVPALGPALAAHGDTPAEATGEAQTAAELALEVLADQKQLAPPSDIAGEYSGQFLLRVPRSLHRALALESAANDTSLNQEVVSRLSGALGAGVGSAGAAGTPKGRGHVAKVRRRRKSG